jgi:hypothetical protein
MALIEFITKTAKRTQAKNKITRAIDKETKND